MKTFVRFPPSAAILIVGLLASIGVLHTSSTYDRARAIDKFEHLATARFNAVTEQVSSELLTVLSTASFLGSSPEIDRVSFRSFTTPLLSIGTAFQALEWVPKVTARERATYESDALTDGFESFAFRQRSIQGDMVRASQRDTYFPVFYVEPYAGNEGALGFDLGSSKARLDALNKARDTGHMVASERIHLVQLKENNTAVLVFAPVYQRGAPRDTIEQRREFLKGFVIGVLRIADTISQFTVSSDSKFERPAGIDLYLFDKNAPPEKELLHIHHSKSRIDKAPALSLAQAHTGVFLDHSFEIGGRTLNLVARPTDSSLGSGYSMQSLTLAFTTLAAAVMLAYYFFMMSNRATSIRAQVDLRTAELRTSENRLRSIQDTLVDGLITIDAMGNMESLNNAAQRIFGYGAEELIGKNINCLMPEPYHSEHDDYLKNFHNTAIPKIIGIGREVIGQRKDGSTFPMDLAVGVMGEGDDVMFTGIIRDVTARKEAELLKTEFISTVSHELRTPLTSIKGSLGLIKKSVLGELPDKMAAMFDIAYNNCERLSLLINDILDLEKLQAGQISMNMQPVNLGDLLKNAIEENTGYAKKFGVVFTLQNDTPNAIVTGDFDRLMQVLNNLMSNAAKFSPMDREVELHLSEIDSSYVISVTDHGPGIPEEFRDKIFDRFAQADGSDARRHGGTGLGLNITRSLLDKHNGTISFETQVGRGTTFFVTLPKADA